MTTTIGDAATTATTTKSKSKEATRLLHDLLAVDPTIRHDFQSTLTRTEWEYLLRESEREFGTMYALWEDDAVGFVTDVLGENIWSKSREILQAIPANVRTAVPSCFSSSKSWTVSRTVLWKSMVHPPSTVKVVTIAPKWSQVKDIVWPEIRKAHARSGLPGEVDQTQLKLPYRGLEVMVANGLAASPYNESAVQGLHAPHLLLVVDEAGGIGHTIGDNLRALLTGSDSRMVCIGNPPSDDEGSWFETLCANEHGNVKVIPISAYDTPNMTGEVVGRCMSCPAEVPAHSLSKHLIQKFQVEETVADHGEDSNYVIAKVKAQFPQGGTNRVIQSTWVETAASQVTPDGYRRVCDLGLPDEQSEMLVADGAWVRLGVDVAADGGDEFVISRLVGDAPEIVHSSSGAVNESAVQVAGVVLKHILRAQALAKALGTTAKVEVKIDGIGVGWGVAGVLAAWAAEQMHDAVITAVVVSEKPKASPDSATLRPLNQRAEMWLAMRSMLEPNRQTGETGLRLNWLERRARAQMTGPRLLFNSAGFAQIEKKSDMKLRGITSPDRAEAVMLALYQPAPKPARRARLLI